MIPPHQPESSPHFAGVLAVEPPIQLAWRERLAAISELTKPRITRLVTITAGVGFAMAALNRSWQFQDLALTAMGCLGGTALSASGANALNMWWERRRDARMARTARRPLPTGRLTPEGAFFAGMLFSILGVLSLLFLAGPAPALVSLVTILWYVLLYTPLKPITPLNTLIGAVPGALPPLIGWSATAPVFGLDNVGGLSVLLQPTGWCLFLLMVVWQIPHFLAIAWMYRDDYAAGGYRMMPIVDPTGRATSMTILVWSVALLATTLAPVPLLEDHLGWGYAAVAAISGVAFIALCVRLARTRTRPDARRVFFASIIHLPLLLMAMVADAMVTRFIL
jgi:protoheme IX farnesyltransferase